MKTIQRMDFAHFTKLPVSLHLQANSTGGVVRVLTPHQGEVLLDLRYDGMLDVYDHLQTRIIGKIRDLEDDAKVYLLDQWLTLNEKV